MIKKLQQIIYKEKYKCEECDGSGIDGQCNDCFDDGRYNLDCKVCSHCKACNGKGYEELIKQLIEILK